MIIWATHPREWSFGVSDVNKRRRVSICLCFFFPVSERGVYNCAFSRLNGIDRALFAEGSVCVLCFMKDIHCLEFSQERPERGFKCSNLGSACWAHNFPIHGSLSYFSLLLSLAVSKIFYSVFITYFSYGEAYTCVTVLFAAFCVNYGACVIPEASQEGPLRSFKSYDDIVMFHFNVPKHVLRATWQFIAFTDSGECPQRKVNMWVFWSNFINYCSIFKIGVIFVFSPVLDF